MTQQRKAFLPADANVVYRHCQDSTANEKIRDHAARKGQAILTPDRRGTFRLIANDLKAV